MQSSTRSVLIGAALTALVAIPLAGCDSGPRSPAGPPATPAVEPELSSSKDFGDYVVHFNAIRTDELTPEVARSYDIIRSAGRAMLNVSILKKVSGTPGVPVSGSVTAQAVNLNGQFKNLTLREIREGEAIYFIGDVPIADEETLVFKVEVTPVEETRRFELRFTRQFVAD